MADAKRIEEFVRTNISLYGLDEESFFGYYDDIYDDDYTIPVEINGKLNMGFVNNAALRLGISPEEVIEADEDTEGKWFDKYDYFVYKHDFEDACKFRHYPEDQPTSHRLLVMLFGTKAKDVPTKYNMEKVKKNVYEYVEKCKIDSHPGAEIENLRIQATDYAHFDSINKMTDSFLDMQRRMQELFFKATKEALPIEEIREYNFLVYFFNARDIAAPSYKLNYNLIRSASHLYRKDGYDDFYLFAKDDSTMIFHPWECAEFVKDKDLVQRYIDQNPMAKPLMREFSVEVASYCCTFNWSDADRIMSEEEWDEMMDFNFSMGANSIEPYSDCRKITTELYIPKSDDELGESKEIIDLYIRLSGPAKSGGVVSDTKRIQKIKECCEFHRSNMDRIQQLVNLKFIYSDLC